MTAPLDLDALEAAERAASPAPWRHEPMYPMMIGHRNVVHTSGAHPVHFGVSEHKNGSFEDAALTVALRNAAPALIALARRVQQDAAREGTHAPDCHLWGRRHYDCLVREYEASRAEIARLRQALEAAEAALLPFVNTLTHDIGTDETDADVFQPISLTNSRAPLLTIGKFRVARDALAKARAALASPAPVSP